MGKLYTIKPLEWREDEPEERWAAQTPFGSYHVYKSEYTGWRWGYCFDEYHDEEEFGCDSPDEGKAKALENWLDRISGALAQSVKAA